MTYFRHLRGIGFAAAALAASATSAFGAEAAATAQVNVRSGPGTSFAVVDQLYAGEVVDVVECNAPNTWCRIYHEGPDGWVSRTYLGVPPAGGSGGSGGGDVQVGITIPLPGGGSITFGTPGYTPPGGGAPPPPPPPAPPAASQVCVYDLPNYLGASTCVNAGTSATAVPGFWNDRVTSLRTFGGASLRLCEHINFGGYCNVFNGNVPILGTPLNNKGSSYDVIPPEPYRVCVYDGANYQGASVCANAGVSAPAIPPIWNDKITSIKVFGGARIRLCQNPGFGGFCNIFSANTPTLGGPLNNNASSYQTW
ncbi:MAG: peptidase inhibitor family I36 protein [Oricola sp.]